MLQRASRGCGGSKPAVKGSTNDIFGSGLNCQPGAAEVRDFSSWEQFGRVVIDALMGNFEPTVGGHAAHLYVERTRHGGKRLGFAQIRLPHFETGKAKAPALPASL